MQGRLYKPPATGRLLVLREVPPAPRASPRPSSPMRHQTVLQERVFTSTDCMAADVLGRDPCVQHHIQSPLDEGELLRAGQRAAVLTSIWGRRFVLRLVKAALQCFPSQTPVRELGGTGRCIAERLLPLAIAFWKFREELTSQGS